jgi:NitT/TauT family transport system substrate-binding protein
LRSYPGEADANPLRLRNSIGVAQVRPYTFNIQPFIADNRLVPQGYATAEPFAIERAAVKSNAFMFSDFGYPGYAGTVSCLESTVKQRGKAVAAFVRGAAKGWRNCLADPTPANALIKKDNPAMSDEQLAHSVGKLRHSGVVTGGDAGRLGIGTITDARAKASYDFMVSAKLVDPARVELSQTYTTEFVRD